VIKRKSLGRRLKENWPKNRQKYWMHLNGSPERRAGQQDRSATEAVDVQMEKANKFKRMSGDLGA